MRKAFAAGASEGGDGLPGTTGLRTPPSSTARNLHMEEGVMVVPTGDGPEEGDEPDMEGGSTTSSMRRR